MSSIWAVLVGLSVSAINGWGETKYIRLRNELIATEESPRIPALRAQTSEPPVNGLYLLQFKGPLQPSWVIQLHSANAKLLRYVPDDAFVARLEGASLNSLKGMAFVRWIGEYRPGHKMHSELRGSLQNAKPQNPARIRLLLAADTPAVDDLQIRRSLQRVERSARWHFGTIIEGQANAAQLDALAQSPSVLWIESAPRPKLNDEVSAKIVGGDTSEGVHATRTQELGYDGRGVVVAVADSGLNNGNAETMHRDLAGRVDAFFYYGSLLEAADEHGHGTHVTGIVAGSGAQGETDGNGFLYGLGVAPGSHIVVQRIFDGEGKYEAPPSYETLTHDAVRSGAVIGSNSWGDDTQGRYDLSAAEFDALVRDADADVPGEQPYILEFSAGNAGPASQTIGSPAVAKNVIATGASQNDRLDFFTYAEGAQAMADFSSRGPCEDGRIKPDLVAPGTWIASLQSASATSDNAWMSISENYQYQGGTSQAGPHVSGAAAVFVQYYREIHTNQTPSPALVKAALINSAVPMDASGGTDATPNHDEGWGRVALTNLIGTSRQVIFLDQTVALTNQQVFEQRVAVASAHAALKVTLTYTDVPGFPAAIPALVNDLDLEVAGPDGRLYRGNQFNAGQSLANPDGRDNLNNVEAVHLLAPEPGEYLIRVRAQNIVEDVHHRTTVAPQQDFALVISGAVPSPGVGILLFDKGAYNAPSIIRLKLIDLDLAEQTSVSVLVTSSTEPAGETVTLFSSGSPGLFMGLIATVAGPPKIDGALQISSGDLITATYQDASPSGFRSVTAVADLIPPVISHVASTNIYGQLIVSWSTDEPAAGVVRFGTNMDLTQSLTNLNLAGDHQIILPHVEPGLTNYFLVIAIDEAGNAATNDNQGRFYSVVSQTAPVALVVDAYQDLLFEVPLSTWTYPLDAVGITYQVWSVQEMGRSPALAELQPFRAVLWRVSEFAIPLSASDVRTIRNYVAGGGALFMSSMELLSQLDTNGFVNFRKNVLHVDSFDEDPGVNQVYGVENLSMTSGVEMTLNYQNYSIDFQGEIWNLSDTFLPTTDAAAVLYDEATRKPVGVRYPKPGEDGRGRVVFLSFPFDTVPLVGDAPNDSVDLMQSIIGFLVPGVNGFGTIELDRVSYGIPARVTVEVADSDLIGVGQIAVSMYVTRLSQRHDIKLFETGIPGQFRGIFTLIDEKIPPLADQYPVRDGDEIRVEYSDISTTRTLRTAAVVDITPPVISQLSAAPEYAEATITWTTSETADALVQFGESKFLSRTAYAAELTEIHSVNLAGLVPDRDYYFQIVSRDAAGNSAVDNRHGQFFSFHTLKPVTPPWVDDFEHTGTNWVVMEDKLDAETNSILQSSVWTLGTPANGLDTKAHSGTNAWGTNLEGQQNDYASVELISPSVVLTGGNQARLRFWQNYDFIPPNGVNGIYEYGTVSVTTNNGAVWTPLANYDSVSGGWEQVELDLTPYCGQIIRIGWKYSLLSMDTIVHPGWLVDDISVEISSQILGAIVITNNLAQAQFSVSGPLSTNGLGFGMVLTQVPLGEYAVQFAPVQFYQTPPPQTNRLDSTNTIFFQGNYTFADVNHNGISDEWEQFYFSTIDPLYTGRGDFDGDGVSDYAEFLAGTNPTHAASFPELYLPVRQASRITVLHWPSVPGHAYRIDISTNLVDWNSATGWMLVTHTNATVNLPPLNESQYYFFRLEGRP